MLTAPPVSSWEVRWFGECPVPPDLGSRIDRLAISPQPWRTDRYLLGTGHGVGVKWREGAIETKVRLRSARLPDGSADVELWVKQRFPTEALPLERAHDEALLWCAVHKHRTQACFAVTRGSRLIRLGVDERVALPGCQVEFTELRVGGDHESAAWTLGFEGFGPEEDQQAALAACLGGILGEREVRALAATIAGGYPAWLERRMGSASEG